MKNFIEKLIDNIKEKRKIRETIKAYKTYSQRYETKKLNLGAGLSVGHTCPTILNNGGWK